MQFRLGQLARARSGDKGSTANVGVVVEQPAIYDLLRDLLTAVSVESHFAGLGVGRVVRYDLPNLLAFNFVLPGILGDGGGSVSLRSDAQGKALGQLLLEMTIDVPEGRLVELRADPAAQAEQPG